jgi:hypothetical protein
MFKDKDITQFEAKGITKEKVLTQVETFKQGIPFVQLKSAATINKGIHKFSEEEKEQFIQLFNTQKDHLNLLKFVPASGAATRMFKALFTFLNNFQIDKESIESYIERTNNTALTFFFSNIEALPFYNKVKQQLEVKIDKFSSLPKDKQNYFFVKEMLLDTGMNYGSFPKGLLPFHKYKSHTATAFEEHLFEAALYNVSKGESYLHFTVSETHKEMFLQEWKHIKERVEQVTKTIFNLSFSFQKQSTDTIAVNLDNTPFRNEDGSVLFRPSGHGALIENLNEVDADVIFIKNIDNVVVANYAQEVANYKMMLAGKLLNVQEKAFGYARALTETPKDCNITEVSAFVTQELNGSLPNNFNAITDNEKSSILLKILNRPIRVCGMVKNEGQPGGGPFFIKDKNGNISLQIVESAQIDTSNTHQNSLLQEATHFNPVDLVCGVRNYKGEKYNLLDFVDASQGFITQKTKEGKDLKALELPGLWNGAMAYWNTLFVEVPLSTFNPVKTVNDLLKPAHQVK